MSAYIPFFQKDKDLFHLYYIVRFLVHSNLDPVSFLLALFAAVQVIIMKTEVIEIEITFFLYPKRDRSKPAVLLKVTHLLPKHFAMLVN